MYNKKVLIDALKSLGSAKAPSNKKDIIVDPNGQWAHPGEITRIPSNTITMQGVPYPVLAKPNVGQPQMMYPGQNYQFPDADYVDEYPQMKKGGESPEGFISAKEGVDTPIYKQVSVKPSKIAGKGLFINEPVKAGEPIGISHIRKVFDRNGESYQAPFPSTVLGYYNHSEEPNVREVDNGDHIVMVATRDIKPNEELTSNYDISGIQDLETSDNFKKGGSIPKLPKKKNARAYSRSLDATNRLLAEHPFFAQPKSRKNKIYDPNSQYFQDGGATTPEDWQKEIKDIESQIGNPNSWTLEDYYLLQDKLNAYRNWRETTPEGQAVRDSHNIEGEYNVPLPNHLQDSTNGMMKARLAYANEFGNPAAKRMIVAPDQPYQFENGMTGTHYMASMDNYAVPQIQDVNGQLMLGDYGPDSNEAMKFDNENDARYFAENYKTVSPAFLNKKQKGGPGGEGDEDTEGTSQDNFLRNWFINRQMPTPEGQKLLEKVRLEAIERSSQKVPYIMTDTLPDNVAGYYDTEDKNIYLNQTYPPDQLKSTKYHERVHFVQDGDNFYKFLTNPQQNLVDQNIKKPKEISTGNPEWDKNLKENYDDIVPQEEMHARIMTLRRLAGFQPDQVITEEMLNNYFNSVKESGKALDPDIEDLKGVTKGNSSIVNLLNDMVSVPQKQDNIQYAKTGGYIDLDLTPEQIQEYAKGGYIIEDISVPSLNQMQDGGENDGSENDSPWNPDYQVPTTYEFQPLSAEQIAQRTFEQEQERLRQEEERFRLEQETWTPKQWDEYRIKEEARKYQQALINEPKYFDEGIQFVKDWHNSPMYNQMVLNSYKGDQKSADYVTKLRKQNIDSIPSLNIVNSRTTKYGDSAPMAWSFSDSGQIEVFPSGFESGPSTYVHEGLHSSDRPRGSFKGSGTNYPSWMLYKDPRFPNENVWFDRTIPLSDQKYITKNRSANYKDSEAYNIALKEDPMNFKVPSDDEIKNEIIAEGISPDDPKFQTTFNKYKKWYTDDVKTYVKGWKENWKEYGHDYVSQPTEVRARLGEFRYYAKKAGIYDPFTEQLTPETYQKFINTYKDDKNKDAIRSIDDLREQYSDEEIMWMLNNISKTNDSVKELDTAAKGGELPKANLGKIVKASGNALSKISKAPASSGWVRGTTTILPRVEPTKLFLGNVPEDFASNINFPLSIYNKDQSGYLTLNQIPRQDNTFSLFANMPNTMDAGRAFQLMNQALTKPNPSILEPFSLSLDSYNMLLNMGKKSDWQLSYENHIPLNYMSVHSNLFEGLDIPKGKFTGRPLKQETADEMVKRLNNMLLQKGITEQARVFSIPGGPLKEIQLPNYRVTRQYAEGGYLPQASMGLIVPKAGQLARTGIYKGVNPAGYGILDKVKGVPSELFNTAVNNSTRPFRVGVSLKYGHPEMLETFLKTKRVPLEDFKKMSDADKMQLFDSTTLHTLNDIGRRRLDAWAVGLGLPQEYSTLEQIGDDKFRMLNTEYTPEYFNDLYNDLRASGYENTLTAGYNPLEGLSREFYRTKLQNRLATQKDIDAEMTLQDQMRTFGWNAWNRSRNAKLNPASFSGIDTGSVWDNDPYGVMGGFRWDIDQHPQGLQFTTSDVWDLNPFEKRGSAFLNPSDLSKKSLAASYFKPLQNLEALKLVGGKPFLIENNFVIDPKTYNTLDKWEDGGNTDYTLGDEVDEATMKELEKLGYTFEKI